MQPSFLQRYLASFAEIDGWFMFDAALMFMAYCELLREKGIAGDVFEIGVHHGLSAIAVAALRGPGARMYAVDLFEEMQDRNVSASGCGDKAIFLRNMARFYPDTGFLRVITRPSSELRSRDLGAGLTFCHIDGGHSRQETYSDLCLCAEALAPGGLVALDDYFNASFPGVSEGAVQYRLEHPDVLLPIAIGYNKVLLQKRPAPFDLNAEFLRRWPMLDVKTVCLWDAPALLMPGSLREHVDLYCSSPERLRRFGEAGVRATFKPERRECAAKPGTTVMLPVLVTNTSREAFPAGEGVLGLSYHLLSSTREKITHDNERAWLRESLQPGESVRVPLAVSAPAQPGSYLIEIDLVWENVMWFADIGNPTVTIALDVVQT
ncbi:MAG: class I SAM-dependent methyltransferase [bacterium]|jgi:hypothetical protein